jgi:hypothetical protein
MTTDSTSGLPNRGRDVVLHAGLDAGAAAPNDPSSSGQLPN